MTGMTKRAALAGGAALALASGASALARGAAEPATGARLDRFWPGAIWRDTAGKPIQVHGGSLIRVGGAFYWYGENKEFTTGKTKVWTWGVRCYRSTDLYNWDDLGLIIPPDETDPSSPLSPTGVMLDRPHILYNRRDKTFVCWVKLMERTGAQTRTVLVADKITGPYRIVRRDLKPLGMNAGDFDLCVSPDDGKAYMYFERVHSELICADLTDDYTDVTGYYSTHFPARPPLTREGPAYFKRRGKHYLATSGMTGYFPNPSEIAVADTFHGPFRVLGDLHPTDRSRSSFNSQICSIFKHPDKQDLYIALADRWLGPQTDPAFLSGETSTLVRRAITKATAEPRLPLTPAEQRAMGVMMTKADTSQARHVWLPLTFEKGRPAIVWRDSWSLDEFG